MVMMVTGRKPNTSKLQLENTDVKINDNGHIIVDEYHKTTQDNIYAVGDVIGKLDLTPVAIRAGRIVGENLYNNKSIIMDYTNIPTIIFT